MLVTFRINVTQQANNSITIHGDKIWLIYYKQQQHLTYCLHYSVTVNKTHNTQHSRKYEKLFIGMNSLHFNDIMLYVCRFIYRKSRNLKDILAPSDIL
ncbi:hypothetical protein FKM82_013702 [Ascaphus truei]